eukprot:GHVU01192854.1.p2 GENE.GHVU01192854.1~~GHVU01192854.1.p2  ORF type:complete len:105 (+),score=4.10 GHVU01192854.1:260-574(+)
MTDGLTINDASAQTIQRPSIQRGNECFPIYIYKCGDIGNIILPIPYFQTLMSALAAVQECTHCRTECGTCAAAALQREIVNDRPLVSQRRGRVVLRRYVCRGAT